MDKLEIVKRKIMRKFHRELEENSVVDLEFIPAKPKSILGIGVCYIRDWWSHPVKGSIRCIEIVLLLSVVPSIPENLQRYYPKPYQSIAHACTTLKEGMLPPQPLSPSALASSKPDDSPSGDPPLDARRPRRRGRDDEQLS